MQRLCEQRELGELGEALNAVGKFRVANPDSHLEFAELEKRWLSYLKGVRTFLNPNGGHDKAAFKFRALWQKMRKAYKKKGHNLDALFPGMKDAFNATYEIPPAMGRVEKTPGFWSEMNSAKYPVAPEHLKK